LNCVSNRKPHSCCLALQLPGPQRVVAVNWILGFYLP
jgi:hypothetical protein